MTTSGQQRESGWYYFQGLVAYKLKNYSGAATKFAKAYDKDNANLMALYFTARSKVEDAEVSASTLKDLKLFQEAVGESDTLIKLSKDAGGHKNQHLFYYIKARAHFDLKEYDSANKAINSAREIKPDDYDILVLDGRILIAKQDYYNAINMLKEASNLKSFKAWEAYLYLGTAFEGIKDTNNAYYYYDKCINSWPPRDVKQEALRRKTNIVSKPVGG